jgi:hypothetical protein
LRRAAQPLNHLFLIQVKKTAQRLTYIKTASNRPG